MFIKFYNDNVNLINYVSNIFVKNEHYLFDKFVNHDKKNVVIIDHR